MKERRSKTTKILHLDVTKGAQREPGHENYRIFVDVNLVKTEQARKDKMLKLLYDFNANASERMRYLRGATGIIFMDNLYLFGSGKSVETLKQVLGNIADGKVTPQKVKGS